MDRLTALEFEVRLNKQASTPRANSEQSVVARPNAVDSENPALGRPATQSELKTFIKEMMLSYQSDRCGTRFEAGVVAACERILHQMKDLDQGPIAQSPSKDIRKLAADYANSSGSE